MPGTLTLPLGGSQSLRANVASNGSGPVDTAGATWTTTDASKVAFNAVGAPGPIAGTSCQICGLAAGTATVTFTLGGFSDTLTVTVAGSSAANITGVSISTS